MRCLRRAPRPRGSVSVEFVLVIVPFMLLFTGVIQLALISVAKLTVHYAAACAARAAVVVIPDNEEMGHDAGNESIRNAAVYALLPITPSAGTNGTIASAFGPGGGWGATTKATGIIVSQSQFGADRWDAQITVRVVYAYKCVVPLASRYFCAPVSELPDVARNDLQKAGVNPPTGRYLILRAQATMTKQGRPNAELNPRKPFI
jgi:Flp pilus assembly protein TadG